jgi:hypothetical protein
VKLLFLILSVIILLVISVVYISNKQEEETVKRTAEENRIVSEKESLYRDTQEYNTKRAQVDQCMKEKGDEQIEVMHNLCLKAGKSKYCTPEGDDRKYLETLSRSDEKECFDKYKLTIY